MPFAFDWDFPDPCRSGLEMRAHEAAQEACAEMPMLF